MTYKKENSGGKKFQSRQPGEKRVRTAKPTRNAGSAGNGRFKKTAGNDSFPGAENKRPYKKYGDGDTTSGGRKSYGRTPSGEGRGYEKPPYRGKDDRPYGEKKTFRKPAGEGRSFDKPGFKGKEDRPYGEKRSYGRKPAGEGRSYEKPGFKGRDDRPYGENKPYRKPAGEGRGFDKPYRGKEEKPYGEKRSYGRKPAGEGRSFDKPGFGNKRGPKKGADNQVKGGYHEQRRDKKAATEKRMYEVDEPKSNYKGRGKAYNKASENMQKGKSLAENETRLNRYIANSGMGSRREADVMIEQGLVVLNGKVVTELGTKVKPGDDVRVDGRRISPEKPIYILLNKPKGYITTTDDPDGRKTVMELIDLPGSERIYPVGRLDRNTTGVLLLTNDGELSQKLMHPSFEIKKIYKVKLDRKPSKDHMLAWVNGIQLEDGFQDFEQCGFVDETDQTQLGVEIHSGRNRIVRRMFEHFGYEVEALDRVMLGDFDHVKLGRGKWRLLNDKEIDYVERLKRMKPKRK